MATLGIPKLQKLDDNKTVNQTLHNSKCTHVTQNRNWTSTTKLRLPDYLHALLLSHTHTLYPRTCHMGGTGDQRDIHTYMPEHHPVRRGIQGSAAWAKPLRIYKLPIYISKLGNFNALSYDLTTQSSAEATDVSKMPNPSAPLTFRA